MIGTAGKNPASITSSTERAHPETGTPAGCGLSAARRVRGPDTDEAEERHQAEKAVHGNEQRRGELPHVWIRRGRPREDFAPNTGPEAECAEHHKHRPGDQNNVFAEHRAKSGLGTHSCGEDGQAGAHPSRVGALGSEYRTVGR